MKKLFSLIKASMSEGMNIFKINTKKKSATSKILIPIMLTFAIMSMVYFYAQTIMEKLSPLKLEFVVLTIFIMVTTILTLVEGIYKSGNLLFNCKDDNLLFSLPIKKSTVLFVRIFKFYVFELLYNTLFLLPAMFLYAKSVQPNMMFYVVSVIGLFIFPIVPILISCLLGTIITFISSKFKGKNLVQIITTTFFLLVVMYVSYNFDNLLNKIAENATNINDLITKLYYPAGAYIELIIEYNPLKLLEFVGIHLGLFVITILLISQIYFNINSNMKAVKKSKTSKNYKIKTSTPMKSLIKKELNRFINSPVFVINAGFGLVLYIVGSIVLSIKFDSIVQTFTMMEPTLTAEKINSFIPVIVIGLVCFTSLMSSITSSMISLEGKSFNILKSLPLKPYKIIQAKVLTAVLIMIPCILVADIIFFIRFKFDILSIILILIASVLLPLVAETIGIIVNLKYPRMDAKNDTEIVKQSMSSSISVIAGMVLIGISVFLLYKAIELGLSSNITMLIFISIYGILYIGLLTVLHKISNKCFDEITV